MYTIESFIKLYPEEREIRGNSDDDCSSKYDPIRGGFSLMAEPRFRSTDRYFQLEPPSTAWSSRLFLSRVNRVDGGSWRGNEGFGAESTESAHHSQENTAGEIKCIGYFARWPRIGRLDVPPIPGNRNFRPSSFKNPTVRYFRRKWIFFDNSSPEFYINILNNWIFREFSRNINLKFYLKLQKISFYSARCRMRYKSYFNKIVFIKYITTTFGSWAIWKSVSISKIYDVIRGIDNFLIT